MSFLNRSVLQERAAAATVEKHPLLKECDVPPNVKQMYLQGCVLAVLERDDGKVTDAARQELVRLGLSLQMPEGDVGECISVALSLNSPEVQNEFLGELVSTLAGDVYPRFFMRDFETLIRGGGTLSDGTKETVDYLGSSLTGQCSWRESLSAKYASQQIETRRGKYVDGIAYQPNDKIRKYLRTIKLRLDIPDGSGSNTIGEACSVYSLDVCSVYVELRLADPHWNDWIENDAERASAVRRDVRCNEYLQRPEVIKKFQGVLRDAIPGLVPYNDGRLVHFVLPDTEYRKEMMRLPCGYNFQGNELGRCISKGYFFNGVIDPHPQSWDEPLDEFVERIWLDGGETLARKVFRILGVEPIPGGGSDKLTLSMPNFKKGLRMRHADGSIEEIKTYGDVYRFFAERCKLVQ